MTAFYDEEKTKEENKIEFDKAHHNKEVVQWFVACVGGITVCCGAIMAVKKLYEEFS